MVRLIDIFLLIFMQPQVLKFILFFNSKSDIGLYCFSLIRYNIHDAKYHIKNSWNWFSVNIIIFTFLGNQIHIYNIIYIRVVLNFFFNVGFSPCQSVPLTKKTLQPKYKWNQSIFRGFPGGSNIPLLRTIWDLCMCIVHCMSRHLLIRRHSISAI